jgi:hypothetical protein
MRLERSGSGWRGVRQGRTQADAAAAAKMKAITSAMPRTSFIRPLRTDIAPPVLPGLPFSIARKPRLVSQMPDSQWRRRRGTGLPAYGSPKMAWPPMRRQRIPGSPPIWIHSKVARPSGPEKLHVISQMPWAFSTFLTRSLAGQGADGSARRRSQAGWNWDRITSRKLVRSDSVRRAQSPSKAGVTSNFTPNQESSEASRYSNSPSGPSRTVTRPAETCSSTSRSIACQRLVQNHR